VIPQGRETSIVRPPLVVDPLVQIFGRITEEAMEQYFPARRVFVLVGAWMSLALSGPAAHAADAAGCADVAGLKRFNGSSIVMCVKRDFTEYLLPTGKNTAYDFDSKKATFEASMNLEGRLTQNVYAVPENVSSADVFRNYKADLAAKGFTLLFEAKQNDTGSNLGSFFEGMGPGTQIWAYSPDEARYLAAVKDESGAKTYIALYIVEYQDGYEPKFSPKKGQAMVRLDALQVGQITDRMVVVSAAEITKDLAKDGKVALYGIVFDFNKATIKPESRAALDEIGKFLKSNPSQNVYVIGHTDNVGGFDSNMQLSNSRASAVVADLSRTYGIPANRMIASGVGLQAPVASNATEEGRAKNRRVELLAR
jgi:outer membrane protein OmpA-like peptidoglycan-associated protein